MSSLCICFFKNIIIQPSCYIILHIICQVWIVSTMLCAWASSESFFGPQGGDDKEGSTQRAFNLTSSTNYVPDCVSTTSFHFRGKTKLWEKHIHVFTVSDVYVHLSVYVCAQFCNRIRSTMFPCFLHGHLIPLIQAGSTGQPQSHYCAFFIRLLARKKSVHYYIFDRSEVVSHNNQSAHQLHSVL